ncbi:MAG: hypothetical protein OEN00_03245, partial [Gemmatimonadota bacterium]|nr:hypothetical protein [Gemmatimonadota bacterium]
TYTRLALLLVAAVACLGGGEPSSLAAQEPGSRPIFLAMPESFPDLDARVVLMREQGRDIIVLRATDAEPEALSVALLVLARVSRERPVPADRGQMIPITGFVPTGELTAEKRAHLETTLADLRRRPMANVGNLGLGRWMRYRER